MGAGESLYVLGINAYDHDVSACLARDGEILVAISKERLTRVKHDTGFYREVVDYCLDAAGIDLDRVDRVVRNSYVLPVPELELRLLQEHRPAQLDARERAARRALAPVPGRSAARDRVLAPPGARLQRLRRARRSATGPSWWSTASAATGADVLEAVPATSRGAPARPRVGVLLPLPRAAAGDGREGVDGAVARACSATSSSPWRASARSTAASRPTCSGTGTGAARSWGSRPTVAWTASR